MAIAPCRWNRFLILLIAWSAAVAWSADPTTTDNPAAKPANTVRVEVDSELLKLTEPQRQKALAELIAPTAVRYSGGKMRLADAVALLTASGNATALDASVDTQREAVLPALVGTYWDAVSAVCDTFELDIKAGIPRGAAQARADRAIAVQCGALELRDRPAGRRATLVANGAVLGIIDACEVRHTVGARREHVAELIMALRLEPKIDPDRIGGAAIRIGRIEDLAGHALTPEQDTGNDNDSADRVRLRMKVGQDLSGLAVSGDIELLLVEPWHINVPLRLGASAAIACGGATLNVSLVDAEHVGLSGSQGPMLELLFPRDSQQVDPRMRLITGGKTVQHRGSGGSQTGSGRVLFSTYHALADAPYDVSIAGTAKLKSTRLELKVPIDFARIPPAAPTTDSDVTLFTPSRISWAAGKTTLQQAVSRFSSTGNQVLLQLGANEQQERDLTAFSGTFWEGVLAVCAAFDVAIMPPTAPPMGISTDGDGSAALAGGPVSLGPKGPSPGRHQANGPLLVEVANVTVTTARGIHGTAREAEAVCHFRLEPRVDSELVGSCSVAVNTFATDDRGRTVSTDEPPASAGEPSVRTIRNMRMQVVMGRINRVYNGDDTTPRYDIPLSVGDLASDAASFRATGQVRLSVHRQVKAEAALSPGVSTLLPFGDASITATLYDTATAEAAGLRQPGLGLMGHGNLSESGMRLIPPSGAQITTNGHGSWVHHGRQEMLYFYPITEEGQYRLVINDVVHIADVKLPYTVEIALP
ncbi:MAG: hypothetical protein H0V44_03435 [Planctomycetes bacterium]|nr:hypothetical protein [Planctomycetota bacterium]